MSNYALVYDPDAIRALAKDNADIVDDVTTMVEAMPDTVDAGAAQVSVMSILESASSASAVVALIASKHRVALELSARDADYLEDEIKAALDAVKEQLR